MQKRDFMNVRAVIALVATLALGAGLVACSSDSSQGPGEDRKIERVVALDWRYEEILKALDVDPVGIVEIGKSEAPTTLKGQLGQATSVGQAKHPTLEVIQSLEPGQLVLPTVLAEACFLINQRNGVATEVALLESLATATSPSTSCCRATWPEWLRSYSATPP